MTAEKFRVIVIVLWLITIGLLYNNGKYGRYGVGGGDFPFIIDTSTGVCYQRFPRENVYYVMNRHYSIGTGMSIEEGLEKAKAHDPK